jgi:hypothetical protein
MFGEVNSIILEIPQRPSWMLHAHGLLLGCVFALRNAEPTYNGEECVTVLVLLYR